MFEMNGKNYEMVACALRSPGIGKPWEIIQDDAHHPIGVASLTQDKTGLRLNYNFKAKAVGILVTTNDETYQLKGLRHGASIGLDYSYIQMSWEGKAYNENPVNVYDAKGNINVFGIFEV